MQTAWKFGLVALIALALWALPGGGSALRLLLTLLTITFFMAIAVLGYRLYKQYAFELDALSKNQRAVLYVSIALAVLTFVATDRLFNVGGAGVLAWLALLGACSYGLFWVWNSARQYG